MASTEQLQLDIPLQFRQTSSYYRWVLKTLFVTAAMAIVGSYTANAELIITSLDSPYQIGAPGTTIIYSGTVQNTGSTLLFIDGTGWIPSGFPPLTGVDLRGGTGEFIGADQTLMGVDFSA